MSKNKKKRKHKVIPAYFEEGVGTTSVYIYNNGNLEVFLDENNLHRLKEELNREDKKIAKGYKNVVVKKDDGAETTV